MEAAPAADTGLQVVVTAQEHPPVAGMVRALLLAVGMVELLVAGTAEVRRLLAAVTELLLVEATAAAEVFLQVTSKSLAVFRSHHSCINI